jgi:chromosome segregation ATPase
VELQRILTEPWFAITNLSSGQPRNYSVQATLAEIRRRYKAIRVGVTEIDRLWVSVLPRVEAARATLDRLETEAADLGVLEPLIGRARALADDLAERLVSDPASVSAQDGSNLDLQVANAAKQMATLRTGHDNLDADLNATEALLASLRVLRARAEAARIEALAKIVDPQGLVRLPDESLLDGPDGMASRLDELFANAATAAWTQKRSLLDAWLNSARKLEAQLIRAGDANRAPLEARNELRGRLRAYSAKIAAMGRAEDIDLTNVVDRARSELYTAPTDLAAADAALTELAEILRS